MDKRSAKQLARNFGVTKLGSKDRVVSPRGEEMFRAPLIIIGQDAFAFTYKGAAVGVLILSSGENGILRYCDREGRVHEEHLMGDTNDQKMHMAMNRMSKAVAAFVGERHPLAQATSANRLPA